MVESGIANRKVVDANRAFRYKGDSGWQPEIEMASKRKRGNSWEFIVKRSGVLDAPLYLTFHDEQEGDEYCRKLESLLDRGIVPTEYRSSGNPRTIDALIDRYTREHAVKLKDCDVLRTVRKMVGNVALASIDANWVDGWISDMKRIHKLAPATIRSKVGALARCTDWGVRKKLLLLPDHPLRTLPEGYASYTEDDAALAGTKREDIERDRRLRPGEVEAIRKVILSRPNNLALQDLFDLALETAMRLREMYTLEHSQVMLDKRTVFLDKTKNGDSRQVPLSSVATGILQRRAVGEGRIFPWDAGSLKFTSNYLSKEFALIFEKAGCGDLHFHDLRHEAVSRLFERTNLSAEEIMKIVGHRSHRMVMRYLSLRGSDLAHRLW